MRYLREQAPSDARWAKHGRAQGCRFYDQPNRQGAVCKCLAWSAVVELTRFILKGVDRHGVLECKHLFKKPDAISASSTPNKRELKQLDKQGEKEGKRAT